MNILFVYNSPIIPENGGVQRVTYVLASYFEEQGHKVHFLSLHSQKMMDDRQFVLPDSSHSNTKKNVNYLSELLVKQNIDVIINQDGLNPDTTGLVLSCEHNGISIISVAHNSIIGAVQHFRYSRYDLFKRMHLTCVLPIFDWRPINRTLLWLFKLTHKSFFNKVIKESDKYVLLSDRYLLELEYILGKLGHSNIVAISNPCTIVNDNVDLEKKEKVMLYVGRIDFSQKRNDLLLKVWEKVSREVPDWKLVVVGGGPNLDKIKDVSLEMMLKRIEFVGQASPSTYYHRSSLFSLTSSFEGFPLTLVEAMANGVVPLAFDSFASLRTIIDDGRNGCVVNPFDLDEYARRVVMLMKDDVLRREYALNALEKSNVFTLESIGQEWEELFKEMNND